MLIRIWLDGDDDLALQTENAFNALLPALEELKQEGLIKGFELED